MNQRQWFRNSYSCSYRRSDMVKKMEKSEKDTLLVLKILTFPLQLRLCPKMKLYLLHPELIGLCVLTLSILSND